MSTSSPNDYIQVTTSKTEVKLKGLPEGWRREVVIRKNGQSAGKTDVYYYSPCGKKFRSKPQIARFLGDHADLSVFDFSRGALTGSSGASHRRARDRHVRRPFDGKGSMSLIKPLSSHPLGASGPIRRTCGVIKLPVLWVPKPKRRKLEPNVVESSEPEPEPMDLSDSRSPVPAPPVSHSNGSVSPVPSVPSDGQVEDKPPKTPEQTVPKTQPAPPTSPSPVPEASITADGGRDIPKSRSPSTPATSSSAPSPPFSPPISSVSTSATSSSSQQTFPALWENRLRGYVVHDHATKTEIKVDQERLRNGVTRPSASGNSSDKNTSIGGGGGVKVENGSRASSSDAKLSNAAIQLPQTTLLNNLLGKQNMITSATSSLHSGAATNVIPSLLAHGIKAHHKHGTTVGMLSATAAGGRYKDSSSILNKSSNSSSLGTIQPNRTNITGGNLIFTLPTITQGAIKMIKQAAAASSRADMTQSSGTAVTGQKQTLRTAGPVLSSTASHSMNNKLQPSSAADGKQNLFVSKSELVRQEERVRRLREQLMAAQGAS